MSWVDDVLAATAESESPRSFIRWAALCSIAAVVKDQIHLDKFYYKLYPNIYVLLVAKSGLRKGFPVALAKTMVTIIDNTRVISGRNSIQAIVLALSQTITKPKCAPLTKAHGFIVSGELSTTFVEDPVVLTILTDLYDGHYHTEGWKNTLKGTGVESLKDISINILGAINQPHFKNMIRQTDITGGFIARTIICEESKRALKNPLIKPPKKALDIAELIGYLKEISQLEGKFQWSSPAADYYEDWYKDFEPEKLEDDTGTANRIHDQILKVAMLLSLSRDTKLILEKQDIEDAMELLSSAIKAAAGVSGHGGESDFGPKMRIVIDEVTSKEDHKIHRSELLRRHYGDFTSIELNVIINTLEQAKAITVKTQGKDEIYTATPLLLDQIKAFEGGVH